MIFIKHNQTTKVQTKCVRQTKKKQVGAISLLLGLLKSSSFFWLCWVVCLLLQPLNTKISRNH